MISAISGFSALSSNMKIMASASNAAPVQQVSRVTRKPGTNDAEVLPFNQSQKSNQLPQDRLVLLGENAVKSGKAYGINVNELRNQSLKNQLSEDSKLPEITGNSSASSDEIISKGKEADQTEQSENSGKAGKADSNKELTQEEQDKVQELKERDAEVKTHEQAHLAVAGSLAQGGASYEYEQGPDGKSYAVGGEVSIDTSPESTPEETISKMQRVKAAAMAPAEPSSQDRSVAASASQQIAKAQQEKNSDPEVEEEEENKQQNITRESSKDSEGNPLKQKTVEEFQKEIVAEAIDGETNEKTAESGLIDIPVPVKPDSSSVNNNKSVPQAKLSIQQYAARVAYGISA